MKKEWLVVFLLFPYMVFSSEDQNQPPKKHKPVIIVYWEACELLAKLEEEEKAREQARLLREEVSKVEEECKDKELSRRKSW